MRLSGISVRQDKGNRWLEKHGRQLCEAFEGSYKHEMDIKWLHVFSQTYSKCAFSFNTNNEHRQEGSARQEIWRGLIRFYYILSFK